MGRNISHIINNFVPEVAEPCNDEILCCESENYLLLLRYTSEDEIIANNLPVSYPA